MFQEVSAIAVALAWADQRGIDLEARLESAELLTPDEVLALRDALWINRIRPQDGRVNSLTHYNRCLYVRDYIVWRAQWVVQRIPNADARFIPARTRVTEFRNNMTSMLSKPRSVGREGLAEETAARLREVIHPNHPENPFQRQHRHRNYALLLTYLDLGVRLSEALVVKGEDLRLSGDRPTLAVHRRPDDRDDLRLAQPLVKTAARVLPLGSDLWEALQTWITKHRRDPARYGAAKKTPYVFVSRTGKPLAKRSVSDMFQLLRKRVSGLPHNLSAHVLRHTWNDAFSRLMDEQKVKDADEIRERIYLMGWSRNSKQAAHYTTRHTREAANRRMLYLQAKSYRGKNR
ncbi:hypothetical protein EAH89_14665 [Roseomonas nepalensis]|uniref:Tyr recombinase domain-containing protein n=1 Tax=Muricoccus nepalensis TaxID=1854500 RepID=A0A502G1S6_9PROT|nr:tyrosine-type recombinase/integrase [Roseomonas nepalensis]TPG55490.1 hypothetical protein EAH89_14665 [Roseomonas nepalensis]